MNKSAVVLLAFAAAVLGQAQSIQSGPDIAVPTSNIRHAGDAVDTRYTDYLHFTGSWSHRSMDQLPPLAMIAAHGPAAFLPGPEGYHPSDIQAAYGMPAGGGQEAIAIVDAYSDAAIVSDFNKFSTEFNLPTETSSTSTASTNKVLQVVYASGQAPAFNMNWAGEESLDVEWAHAVAPGAKIYLVEAAGESEAELDAAVEVAASLPNVVEVSMSWGASGETAGEQSEDSVFTQPGVAYFGATGDEPANRGYPAMSPNVMAVGGTSVNIVDGVVSSEKVWYDTTTSPVSGTGCGDSIYIARPTYQNAVQGAVGNFRGTPDVCADADPNTGVAVYNSNDIGQDYNVGGWEVDGGTSLSTPLAAAITNVRANYSATSFAEHTRQYGLLGSSNIRDITQGDVVSPTKVTYQAAPGYDLASGLGEEVGLFSTTTLTVNPGAATPMTGSVIGGSVASLNAIDGNCYVVQSQLVLGKGEVAEAQITFNASAPAGYSAVNALKIAVDASAISGVTEQIEALNIGTGNYDVLGAASLTSGGVSSTVTASPATYINSSGSVTVRLLAVRPQTLGYSPFAFRVDQAVLNATFAAG